MTAARLREAAALMRERAEAATEGPWRFEPAGDYECGEPACCSEYWDNRIWGGGVVIAESHLTSDADSKHIASRHPAVALAVADWLDDTAKQLDARHPNPACDLLYDGNALAVADAYLGGRP